MIGKLRVKLVWIGLLLSFTNPIIYAAQEFSPEIERQKREEHRIVLEQFELLTKKLNEQEDKELEALRLILEKELREYRKDGMRDLTESEAQALIASFWKERGRREASLRAQHGQERARAMKIFAEQFFPNMKPEENLEAFCVV